MVARGQFPVNATTDEVVLATSAGKGLEFVGAAVSGVGLSTSPEPVSASSTGSVEKNETDGVDNRVSSFAGVTMAEDVMLTVEVGGIDASAEQNANS